MENKIRVLYGDDKAVERESLAKQLRLRNVNVDLASSAEEMLAMAKANSYHAFVTDLEYTKGGKEGYEVLSQLKNYSGLKVIYSGVAGFEHEMEAFERGADYAVLRKNEPLLLEVLARELKLGDNENGKVN
ncbi:MAG: response regulator [archaeon]